MSPWFKRPEGPSPLTEATVHFVCASTAINATRRQIWDFIKPPENAALLSPGVVSGFRAPDVEGLGEIQVFISVRAGIEQVSALEIMEEIPLQLAVTRILGGTDSAARMRYFIHPGDNGAMILDIGQYFTIPAEDAENLAKYEQHYWLGCQQLVDRVKAFFEQSAARRF
ncbi:hypothetical protein J2Y41_004552 [Arthrobacter sp. 1088]|uniref:hypothetical protein n=1 Tax=Arthrobacter sp. 1088 TaxID=2817768 RepID=UPI00285D09DF|nr:hypothetical protein [Arthrobacter sp. 1088]MDR6688953.1 hypothetical protein [Arthrobacter sp. 1088]